MKTKLVHDCWIQALITQPLQHLGNVVGRVQRAIEHYLPVGLLRIVHPRLRFDIAFTATFSVIRARQHPVRSDFHLLDAAACESVAFHIL